MIALIIQLTILATAGTSAVVIAHKSESDPKEVTE